MHSLVTQVKRLGQAHLHWINISDFAEIFSTRLPVKTAVFIKVILILCFKLNYHIPYRPTFPFWELGLLALIAYISKTNEPIS